MYMLFNRVMLGLGKSSREGLGAGGSGANVTISIKQA